jgi:hypothetical protein
MIGDWYKLPGPASPEGGLGPGFDAYVTVITTDWLKKCFCSLLKFRAFHTILILLNLNMTTNLPSHPPVLRERGLN